MSEKQLSVQLSRTAENVVVIDLEGEIDIYTAPEFRDALLQAIDEGARRVVVDVSKVTFMDSTGLGVFVSGEKRIRPQGGLLLIVCQDETIMRIFQITGLADVFTFRETREAALQVAAGWA
jgi:anti-sigma B factor antagonist